MWGVYVIATQAWCASHWGRCDSAEEAHRNAAYLTRRTGLSHIARFRGEG